MFVIDRKYVQENCTKDSRAGRKKIKINSISVTLPEDYILPIPICCEVCEYPMRDERDSASYEEDNCCNFCQTFFAKKYKEKWVSGWRPSRQDIESQLSSIGAKL